MSLISGNESKIFAKGEIGNVRKAQEDSHGLKAGKERTPNGDLFVVCDGMGGHVGGAKASSIAVESIINRISEEKRPTPIDALNDALQFANMQILGFANDHPEFKGMGTTACILLLQDDGAWIAHVGDSRIYLYLGKEKQLHRITKDHSYVQTLVDQGIITDDQAEHHPNKNRIMKALGIKPELQPTFNYENKPIHPKNGDIFLICSDGLSGMIPDRTIERVLGEEKLTLQQKGDELIRLAMEGETVQPGGQDNCTLELIEVDNSNWKNSEFKSYSPYRIEIKEEEKMGNKVFVKVLITIVAVLLLMGSGVWWLTPRRYDNVVKKAAEDTVPTYKEMMYVKQKYDSMCSIPSTIPEGDANVNNSIDLLQAKKTEMAEMYKRDSVEPAINRHNAATKRFAAKWDARKKAMDRWNNIFPVKKK